VITSNGREVRAVPLVVDSEGRQSMDLDAAAAALQGNERMVILCSPHNPGGRVWTQDELRALADFAVAHDLILVSDEIHHDLVFPGARHIPMTRAAPDIADRLVMLTAASKTFNIAGAHVGNVIIPDAGLRKPFAQRMAGLGISPNSFGLHMVTAAYSPEGAEWLAALMTYLDGNRRLFDEGIAEIPGLKSVALEATYLAWVDFSGTGMEVDDFTRRVEQVARIAVNRGETFGTGGESYLRFNFATPRVVVAEAVARLQAAFDDLQ
jgi:cystathionine beta-lyase